jgi:flavodoxin
MKMLVVFYSLDGNTRLIAEAIAETVKADLLELKPVKEITRNNFLKYFSGGKEAMTKAEPELIPFDIKPENYDVIFIGTPVWAWTYAPALRTFFKNVRLKDKKVALFCCHGGGPRNFFEKFEEAVKGNTILGKVEFKDPIRNEKERDVQMARDWAKLIIGI